MGDTTTVSSSRVSNVELIRAYGVGSLDWLAAVMIEAFS
jgi:hypothetical protein